MLGRPLQGLLHQLGDPRESRGEDLRVFGRFGRQAVLLDAFAELLDGRLQEGQLPGQTVDIAGFPVAAFVADFQVGEELGLQRGEHFRQRHVAFERAELRLHEAPRHFRELAVLGVFDVGQPDQPAFRRDQEARRFLSRAEIEDDAADNARRVVVGGGPPDVGLAAEFQGQVEDAVLEIFDAIEAGDRAAVVNRDAHGCMRPCVMRGLRKACRYRLEPQELQSRGGPFRLASR